MPLNYDLYLQASNGSGEAVRSNVVVDRPIGSTEINVDTVLNWPSKFIATSGVYDALTGTFDPTTITVFFGHINGTYITIDEFAAGYTDRGNHANEMIVIKPTTSWADKLAGRVALPAGGTSGQFLGKNSSTAGDASWNDLPNLSTWVPDQGLAGTVNGTNKIFTTASNFAAIIIYKNGVTLHVGDDYTITGSNQVTFITAPITGTKLTCTYVTSTTTQLSGTASVVSDQPVTGLVNGSNAAFTTPQPYVGGTLEVYINGQKQVRTTHFTETTPGSGIFTMSDAPFTGDIISVNYQLSLTVTGNADTLDGIHANPSPTANTLLPLNANAKFDTNRIENLGTPDTAWIIPTYQNSWVKYDTTYNVPGYRKDAEGFVHLRGMIALGTAANATMFTLPVGYRPILRCLCTSQSAAGMCRVDVQVDGTVSAISGGSTSWVSLECITFKAEQ